MSEWRPIAVGDLRARAWREVDELAAALAAQDAVPEHGLFGGAAGVALFFTYLAKARPGAGHDQAAARFLDQAIDSLGWAPGGCSLSGYVGIAWVVEHLQGRLITPDGTDSNREIDDAVIAELEAYPATGSYDLISGLAGLAVYGHARRDRPFGRRCLQLVAARLAERAEREPRGVTWKTAASELPAHTRADYPDGYYNLGVAHGVPAAIWALAAASRADADGGAAARGLVGDAIAWLLARGRTVGDDANYGYNLDPRGRLSPGRTAWCYGDPGVACALLGAIELAGVTSARAALLDGALIAARRPVERCGVNDAGLCHGAAGLLQLFGRLHSATGHAAFADAARRWLAETLACKREGQGVAGYPAYCGPRASEFGKATWSPEAGLLTGAAGVGLALLAAVSDVAPAWDAALLMELP